MTYAEKRKQVIDKLEEASGYVIMFAATVAFEEDKPQLNVYIEEFASVVEKFKRLTDAFR